MTASASTPAVNQNNQQMRPLLEQESGVFEQEPLAAVDERGRVRGHP